MSLNVQIDAINVAFNTFGDKDISVFLQREFPDVMENINNKPDIHINFRRDDFKAHATLYNCADTFAYYGGKIVQGIKAHFRTTWITYDISPVLGSCIDVYIGPRQSSRIGKMISGFKRALSTQFLYPWQNSIIDFIHGPLMSIIQLNLLKKSSSFLHASSISRDKAGIVFPGYGQTGKSTIADRLTKKQDWRFISEDMCIINSKKCVLAYNKQRGLNLSQLKDTEYYNFKRANCIADKANILLIRALKLLGIQPVRILSISELFEADIIMKQARLTAAVYIKRGNYSKIRLEKTTGAEMASLCSSAMKVELENMGLIKLLSCYNMITNNENDAEVIFESMEKLYMRIFQDVQSYVLMVPDCDDLSFIEKEIHPLLISVADKWGR